jgi:cytoskeletal protein RodZ
MSTIKSGLVVGLIGALTVPALALATDDHPPLRLPTATTAAPQPASTAPAEATQPVPPAAASTAPSPALALSPTSLDPPNVKPAAAPQTDTDPKAGVSATDTASANAGRDTVTSQAER